MTAQKALFLTGDPTAVSYATDDVRNMLAAVFGGRNFEAVAPGVGAVHTGHGVLSMDAMAVTANGTPNNTTHVAPGFAAVRGTQNNNQGVYVCGLDADFVITHSAAHATLDRIDFVVAQVRDDQFTAFTEDDWTPRVITGTAGAGDPAVAEDALVLARVTVVAGGSTVITTGNIQDVRPHTRAVGGITPVSTPTAFPSPKANDWIFDLATRQLLARNAGNSAWEIAAALGAGTVYSGGNPFNNLILGSGGVTYGRYYKLGRLVLVLAGFQLGTGGDLSSTLEFNLPFTAANISGFTGSDASVGGFCAARAFANNSSVRWSGTGIASASTMTNFVSAGASAVWTFTQPFDWSDAGAGSKFQAVGIYEATT